MGVYLDELRVVEIFEGSPAEKACWILLDGGKTREMGVWVGDTSQLWVCFWDWQVGEINVD